MTNTILCRNNGQATHIVEFTTVEGNVFSVLTDEPNNVQAVLESAEEYIWTNGLENSTPGYIPDATDMPDDEVIRLGCGGAFENCFRDAVHIRALSRAEILDIVSAGQFMQPLLYHGTVYAITDAWGETDYVTEYPAEENAEDIDIDILDGFLPYVAANGYMDRVDLGFYETEAEAIEALIDYYCE